MEVEHVAQNGRPLLFLSYRQKQSGPEVREFKSAAQTRFPGADVFMDGDDIVGGGPLSDQLWTKLRQANVIIVFFGPRWAVTYKLRHLDASGIRNQKVEDWPADELEWALKHKPEATHCVSTGHEEEDDTFVQRRAQVLEVWDRPYNNRLKDRRWRPLFMISEHRLSIDVILDDVAASLQHQGLYDAATITKAEKSINSQTGVYTSRVYDESSGFYKVYRMPSNLLVYSYKPARKIDPLSDERLRTWMRSELYVDDYNGAIWIWEPTGSSFHVIEKGGSVTVAPIKELPPVTELTAIHFVHTSYTLAAWLSFYSLGPDDYPLTTAFFVDLNATPITEGRRFATVYEEWNESHPLGSSVDENGAIEVAGILTTPYDAIRRSQVKHLAEVIRDEISSSEDFRCIFGGYPGDVTIEEPKPGKTNVVFETKSSPNINHDAEVYVHALTQQLFNFDSHTRPLISIRKGRWVLTYDFYPMSLYDYLRNLK